MPDGEYVVGIFDSGVGGLTVLRRLTERVPSVATIYLGDTARVPYGTKSADTVVRYASACARVLMDRGVDLIVVACNTASAFALDALQKKCGIPVIGVIQPGAREAVAATNNQRIGVIGTAGTVRSGAYQRAIQSLAPQAHVVSKPCPLFVPLAEEGWTEGEVPTRIAESYLAELRDAGIDTLVLGCTHYPILKAVIADVMGPDVTLIDSAQAVSTVVEEALLDLGFKPGNPSGPSPSRDFLATDSAESFQRVSEHFLGGPIDHVEWVDVA